MNNGGLWSDANGRIVQVTHSTGNKYEDKYVPIPFPVIGREERRTVWHYTDAAGLLGILTSQSLFASAASAMNDAEELSYGEHLFRDAWDNYKAEKPNLELPTVRFMDEILGTALFDDESAVYALSASLEGDLLNQWHHYGSSSGYAVGIDSSIGFAAQPQPTKTQNEMPIIYKSLFPLGWGRVVYSEPKQQSLARAFIPLILQATPGGPASWAHAANTDKWPDAVNQERTILRSLACFLKNPAFAAEREARFVTDYASDDGRPEFRVSGGRLLPFTRLASVSGRLPIREIIVGPTADGRAISEVKLLLASRGYEDVIVSPSRVPLLRR